jgi:hypothetical protein
MFHAFNHSQINLLSRLMLTGRKYRIWPTRNGGLAIMWQTRTGLTVAGANGNSMHDCKVYLASAPYDDWQHGSGARGVIAVSEPDVQL